MQTPSKRFLLLVEDEPIVALGQQHILQSYGYSVEVARTGEAAVAAAANPELDLVLMDIDLGPGMSGDEAARRILAFRDLPIVFLTSHAEREERYHARFYNAHSPMLLIRPTTGRSALSAPPR